MREMFRTAAGRYLYKTMISHTVAYVVSEVFHNSGFGVRLNGGIRKHDTRDRSAGTALEINDLTGMFVQRRAGIRCVVDIKPVPDYSSCYRCLLFIPGFSGFGLICEVSIVAGSPRAR